MQYDPKLKVAMEKIKAVLKEHDIAGAVVLHTPGFSEHYVKIDPSYSCAKPENNVIRVRAKLQEDFNGDKDAWTKKMTDTTNMFIHLSGSTKHISDGMSRVIDMLKEHMEITDLPGTRTDHTTQNN